MEAFLQVKKDGPKTRRKLECEYQEYSDKGEKIRLDRAKKIRNYREIYKMDNTLFGLVLFDKTMFPLFLRLPDTKIPNPNGPYNSTSQTK